VSESLTDQIVSFVQRVAGAMGVTLTATVEQTADGTADQLRGRGWRHPDPSVAGEGLQALQHLVATAFRRQLGDDTRIVVDCNGYRR
jgi:predicted RNA-binding protein Jag